MHVLRRFYLRVMGVALSLLLVAPDVRALDSQQADALIQNAVNDVYTSINSGKSDQELYVDFENIFSRYADVEAIARSALGPAVRSATPEQVDLFIVTYRGYLARKYGRQFRDLIGADIIVEGARERKSYYEVLSKIKFSDGSVWDILWHVSDKSGTNLFFNIIITGINMLSSERIEVGARLERNGGNIDALIEELAKS